MPTPARSGRVIARLAPIALVALLVAACSGGGSGGIKVTEPWARNAPKTAGAGAAYMVIQNTGSAADAVVGGTSPVAKAVEVHETYVVNSAMPDASAGTGSVMMGMRKIDRLEIPAGGSVELKPGSYHLMLIDLTQELKAGEKIEITLKFEKAGDVKVSAEVRAN